MLDNSGSDDRIIQVFTKVWVLSFVKVGVLTSHHILAARLFKNVQSSAQEIMVNNGFWDTVKNCIYNLTRWQRHRGAAEEKYLSE